MHIVANATGVYGAFESNANGEPPSGPGRGPPNRDDPRPPHRPPGRPGSPPPGGPRGGPPMSSSNTWLRGGSATGEDGTVELWTIYPGFYAGRTIHLHLMVHMGWEEVDGFVTSANLSSTPHELPTGHLYHTPEVSNISANYFSMRPGMTRSSILSLTLLTKVAAR